MNKIGLDSLRGWLIEKWIKFSAGWDQWKKFIDEILRYRPIFVLFHLYNFMRVNQADSFFFYLSCPVNSGRTHFTIFNRKVKF